MSKTPDIQSPLGDKTLVMANYTILSENIRRLTPQGIQCSVFCGGNNCKYENPESWTADSLALQGIYSHWITDDILAMARPSTAVIIKKNIIQQFQSLGIRSIINLQSPREHASCGEPLEDTGFSYDPNVFMENNIYYYNFAWKDYGDASLSELLNMIKVLAFAITEGRVAIHCHAGLGRTGVLIACYLVYSLKVPANDAIKYVRLRRPGSVQTRGQIVCVRHFAQFILPQSITFYIKDSKDKYMTDFTLTKFLKRQKIILHGYDERHFKFIPKIIHEICERILQLCGCHSSEFLSNAMSLTSEFLYTKLTGNFQLRHESIYSISSALSDETPTTPGAGKLPSYSSLSVSPSPSECEDQGDTSQLSDSFSDLSTLDEDEIREQIDELLNENKCYQELRIQKNGKENLAPKEIYGISDVIHALLIDYSNFDAESRHIITQMEQEINASEVGWMRLKTETNVTILAASLFDWVENLKAPVLSKENLEVIVVHYNQVENCFKRIAMEDAYLIEYLLNFLIKLHPISKEDQESILMRFVASLAQQTIAVHGKLLPSGRGFHKLREGTLSCTAQFFKTLLPMIEQHHRTANVSVTAGCDKNAEDLDNSDEDCGFH